VFYVAIQGRDLLASPRTRASAVKLSQPELIARGALAAAAPGDTVTLTASRAATRGGGACLGWNDARACGLGYTMGDGWQLIFFPRSFPDWALATVNALWMAGWTLGVGWWGRRHAASGAALALLALVLLLGPAFVGLNPTPPGEIAGALGGVGMGWGLRGGWATHRAESRSPR
jgi:hypothetical protein